MEITLSSRQMDELAYKIALIVDKWQKERRQEEQPELVGTKEAARLLDITPDRLRHIVCENPNLYPHIKRGEGKQARLMFVRDALLG